MWVLGIWTQVLMLMQLQYVLYPWPISSLFNFLSLIFFQSQWVWGGFLLWFWFAFLLSLIMFHLFLCLLVICIFSLKGVYSNPLPILKASCLSFCCWLVRVLCFVRFRVEAKKTHFSYGSSKMKAWFFWALREAASSGSELHLQRKLVQHF